MAAARAATSAPCRSVAALRNGSRAGSQLSGHVLSSGQPHRPRTPDAAATRRGPVALTSRRVQRTGQWCRRTGDPTHSRGACPSGRGGWHSPRPTSSHARVKCSADCSVTSSRLHGARACALAHTSREQTVRHRPLQSRHPSRQPGDESLATARASKRRTSKCSRVEQCAGDIQPGIASLRAVRCVALR